MKNILGGKKEKKSKEGICILHKCHKLQRNAVEMFHINRG